MRRALGWAAAVLVAAALLSTLTPAALGLSMRTPWAQLVGLRAVTAALCLVLALLLLSVVGLRRLRRRRRPGRPCTRQRRLLLVVLVAAVVALGHVGVLLARGALTAPRPVAAGPEDLVVLALNAQVDGVDPAAVVDLAVRSDADAVALSEASARTGGAVADELAAAGRPVQVLCSADPAQGVADPADPAEWVAAPAPEDAGRASLLPYVRPAVCLLVSTALGPYAQVEGPALRGGAVVARPAGPTGPAGPAGLSGPPLAVVHPLPPTPVLFDMDLWRAESRASVEVCEGLEGAVVAGDYNATEDHAVLQGLARCADAAALAGGRGQGTWPSSLPALLASRIDHVLVDPARWQVRGTAVERVPRTDHRAVVAVLRER